MNIFSLRYMFLLAGAFTAPGVTADDTVAPDTIIVTATRTPVALDDTISVVTVIDRTTIENSLASDLGDLLRFEAGIDLARSGGPGQNSSAFVRGAESNHTLVLIDGVRMNPGSIGGAAIQNIAPTLIERIEIVKAPRSALYGNQAIGGVINVITRRGDASGIELSALSGSYDTRQYTVATTLARDRFSAGLGIDYYDTDGYPSFAGSELDRGYDRLSVNAHARLSIGDSSISLRHWQASGNTEYLDFFADPLDQDYKNQSTALELRSPAGERFQSTVTISRVVDDIRQNQLGAFFPVGTARDFVETERLAADWNSQLNITDEHTLSGGLYYGSEDVDAISFASPLSARIDTSAIYIQDQLTVGDHDMLIAGRYTDHEFFGGEFSWNGEYGYRINDLLRVSAGIGTAFREPDATDLYGFGGSTTLQPESSSEQQLNVQITPGGDHKIVLSLYANDIDNLIEFDLQTFALQNIAEAEIRGGQIEYDYSGANWSVNAQLTRQNAEDKSNGERLLRRSERSVSARISRAFGDHSVGISMLASSDRPDFGGVSLPGYGLVNFNGRYRISDNWVAIASIENLLDADYETVAGYNTPGRSAYLELRYRTN